MPDIVVGCALSDLNRTDLPGGLRVPERLADYLRMIEARVGGNLVSVLLQPEDYWTTPTTFPDQFEFREQNRWWRTFRESARLQLLFAAPKVIAGVHQPVERCDLLASSFYRKYKSIEDTKAAMDFADYIAADYFVMSLAQADKWNWDRRDQMNKALKMVKLFATYFHTKRMTFTPCIETAEYPRFPASGGELSQLMAECKQIWPEVRVALDISQLYGARERMIATGKWPDASISFIDALAWAFEQNWQDLHVIQLGGCWESELHAIPGLHPQEDPFRYPLKLRESPSTYAEVGEMDLNAVLDLIVQYTVRKGRDLNLVLQVTDRDVGQVLEAGRLIRNELAARAEQPAEPLEPPEGAPRRAAKRAPRVEPAKNGPGKKTTKRPGARRAKK